MLLKKIPLLTARKFSIVVFQVLVLLTVLTAPTQNLYAERSCSEIISAFDKVFIESNLKHGKLVSNPYFSPEAEQWDIVARQWVALNTILESNRAPEDLRRLARQKLEWINKPPDLQTMTAGQLEEIGSELLHSVEFSLLTFKSLNFDHDFQPALIRLLRDPEIKADQNTISTLMPFARGVDIVNSDIPRMTNETIRKITKFQKSSFPIRSEKSINITNHLGTLRHSKITNVEKLAQNTANQTMLVHFENGQKAIFKPMTGELGYLDSARSPDWILFTREANAYDIVHTWLLPQEQIKNHSVRVSVPPTIETALYHEGTSYGVGSLQLFKKGYMDLDKFMKTPHWDQLRNDKRYQEAEALIRTLDYLLNNYDRFPNRIHTEGRLSNIMVKYDETSKDFELALIDNGIGRNDAPAKLSIDDCPVRNDIHQVIRESIFNLDIDLFEKEYAHRLPKGALEDFKNRVYQLRNRIKHGP